MYIILIQMDMQIDKKGLCLFKEILSLIQRDMQILLCQ